MSAHMCLMAWNEPIGRPNWTRIPGTRRPSPLVIQTNVINGTGLAFMSMDLSIKRPANVGDTIHVVVEVTQARAA